VHSFSGVLEPPRSRIHPLAICRASRRGAQNHNPVHLPMSLDAECSFSLAHSQKFKSNSRLQHRMRLPKFAAQLYKSF
jgi:hypothetical protein